MAAAITDSRTGTPTLVTTAVVNQTTIGDSVWDEALSGHTTAGTSGKALSDVLVDTAEIGTAGAGLTNIDLPNQTMDITGNITGNLSGSVGSVTGAVGSVTGAVGSVTGNVGGNVTGSVGSVVGAVGSVTGAVGSVTGAVGSVTGNVGGNVAGSVNSVTSTVSADVVSISGSAAAANNLEESTEAIVYGTANAGGNTTTIITKALTPDATVADQFKGRVLIFKNDTTTAALQGQATTISSHTFTSAEVITMTVVALTTAPADNDTFVIL
jgi:hypothetical protein